MKKKYLLLLASPPTVLSVSASNLARSEELTALSWLPIYFL
ncbi:MAG TPA: hypothetical protein VGW31_02745 [Hanamia sp.]|nr:hypothetical protein [Hanamia sp.]